MGFWRKLLGLEASKGAKGGAGGADMAAGAVRDMLEGDSGEPEVEEGFTAQSASPKQVFRYIFAQLASGHAPDDLAQELVRRGFARKTASSYIALIQKTMFGRR